MESAADLRDLLTASREPKRRLETNVYTKLGVNTLVTYREDFNSKIFAKFVSKAAFGIEYCYKNNIGLLGLIRNVTELFQQLWQLLLSVTVIK